MSLKDIHKCLEAKWELARDWLHPCTLHPEVPSWKQPPPTEVAHRAEQVFSMVGKVPVEWCVPRLVTLFFGRWISFLVLECAGCNEHPRCWVPCQHAERRCAKQCVSTRVIKKPLSSSTSDKAGLRIQESPWWRLFVLLSLLSALLTLLLSGNNPATSPEYHILRPPT